MPTQPAEESHTWITRYKREREAFVTPDGIGAAPNARGNSNFMARDEVAFIVHVFVNGGGIFSLANAPKGSAGGARATPGNHPDQMFFDAGHIKAPEQLDLRNSWIEIDGSLLPCNHGRNSGDCTWQVLVYLRDWLQRGNGGGPVHDCPVWFFAHRSDEGINGEIEAKACYMTNLYAEQDVVRQARQAPRKWMFDSSR
eukprot:TRINITY_DN102288_c0_g1_i1.p1 TRINITY_DN102288_c0_g1~~TRINITY_DN102288_c0_g1_i1.p1  ORF type:complete len:198 (+),score=37.09 TRINITY_DN102288_c0_g1_i1:110-703(+)